MEENWKDVPGYEGKYQISIDTPEGRCRSLNYNKKGITKEMSNKPDADGRIHWNLRKDGVRKNYQAARWIAITYPELVEGKYFEGAVIDHIDTNRMNNHPSNLRWTDTQGNCNNPITRENNSKSRKGHTVSKETRGKISESLKGKYLNSQSSSKWIIKLSIDNEILHFYQSAAQAERETGISRSNINYCLKGKTKHAGGFVWKYAG